SSARASTPATTRTTQCPNKAGTPSLVAEVVTPSRSSSSSRAADSRVGAVMAAGPSSSISNMADG
ncbi:hypothetical protein H0H87_008344, partial [Tephrocybe sp. NHM501043]